MKKTHYQHFDCGNNSLNTTITLEDEKVARAIRPDTVVDVKKNIILNGVITDCSRFVLTTDGNDFIIRVLDQMHSMYKVETVSYPAEKFTVRILEESLFTSIDVNGKWE
jgi:predicted transcriptional regulator